MVATSHAVPHKPVILQVMGIVTATQDLPACCVLHHVGLQHTITGVVVSCASVVAGVVVAPNTRHNLIHDSTCRAGMTVNSDSCISNLLCRCVRGLKSLNLGAFGCLRQLAPHKYGVLLTLQHHLKTTV